MKIRESIDYITSSPMFNWSRTHGHRSTLEKALRKGVVALEKQAELEELLNDFWTYHKPADRLRADDVYMILKNLSMED